MTTRRSFMQAAAFGSLALTGGAASEDSQRPLGEFDYSDVDLAPGPAQTQFEQTQSVLLSLNEDGLLKPWRLRAGLPAPGPDLGGWYDEVPLDKTPSGGHGFAPAHCFGQWVSALARGYRIDRNPATLEKLEHLLALYEPAISGRFYQNFRFPAYDFDKMVIGLSDAQQFAGISRARDLLNRTADAAEPHLPPTALDRDEPQRRWRASVGDNTTNDYTWDESYTLPENLYLAAQRGAGERYRTLARRFLLDRTYFDPLSENRNVLPNHHAYSFCNALSSAMQAYLSDGSEKHLRAGHNAFEMIAATQSYATGGWGPNESFVVPGTGALAKSLTTAHHSFETPCGSYAHFKLTRYLLRVTRDGRYGDSMERVLYNTVLGAKPLQQDGRAFYYSDYNNAGAKVYFTDAWPCCSGTLPQVAADYRIFTYFRDQDGVFVNLYLPSRLRWTNSDGAQLSLQQQSKYPYEGSIAMNFKATRPASFALRLRIPAWSPKSEIKINGVPVAARVVRGFATVRRQWKDGDRIDVDLALPLRLEPIDPEHPATVAVMRGPLVMFGAGEHPSYATREELLRSVQMNSAGAKWKAFVALNDEQYRTYFDVNSPAQRTS